MHYKRLMTAALLTLAISACQKGPNGEAPKGEDVTQSFFIQYNGSYVEQTGLSSYTPEKIVIHRDGRIEETRVRDVGVEGNDLIPPGTVCSYELKGQILSVTELDDENRLRVSNTGENFLSPQTHEIDYTVYQAKLTNDLHPGTLENVHCRLFMKEMRNGNPEYQLEIELFGAGTFRTHTQGGSDYQGLDRTESTLDEVFVRL